VQAAIKNIANGDLSYFHIPVNAEALFTQGAAMDAPTFAGQWKAPEGQEASGLLNNVPSTDVNVVKGKLAQYSLAFIAERQIPNTDQTAVYFSAKTAFPEVTFLVEIKFKAGANIAKITVKSPSVALSEVVKTAVSKLLSM
jgi:hypothetical protein